MESQNGNRRSGLSLMELTNRVSKKLGRHYYPSYINDIRKGFKGSAKVLKAISEIEAEVRRERRAKKLAPQSVETIA
jgi:hypothetical protein